MSEVTSGTKYRYGLGLTVPPSLLATADEVIVALVQSEIISVPSVVRCDPLPEIISICCFIPSQDDLTSDDLTVTGCEDHTMEISIEFAQGHCPDPARRFLAPGSRIATINKKHDARMIQTLTQERNDCARIIIDCSRIVAAK